MVCGGLWLGFFSFMEKVGRGLGRGDFYGSLCSFYVFFSRVFIGIFYCKVELVISFGLFSLKTCW